MKKFAFVFLILMFAGNLCAQGSATFHVFPQVADGIVPGTTTGYVSTLVVTNTSNQSSNCTVRLYGGVSNRLAGSSTFTLQGLGSFSVLNTTLASLSLQALATGYGTLTCSQPVTAAVAYLFVSISGLSGTVTSAATVFSSPSSTRAQLVTIAGSRLAIAIANDTDAVGVYQITLVNGTGQTVSTGNVSVPARSNVAKFADEIMTVPPDLTGAVSVSSSAGTGPFSLLGLVFIGTAFTSEPAAILAP